MTLFEVLNRWQHCLKNRESIIRDICEEKKHEPNDVANRDKTTIFSVNSQAKLCLKAKNVQATNKENKH
jgi:hypothetical protein